MRTDPREFIHCVPGENPSGPQLLLLPPAGASVSIWQRLRPALLRHWSQVLMVGMPGRERHFGHSAYLRIDDAIESISAGLPEPRNDMMVIGHSLGGLIGFGVVAALERRWGQPLGHLVIAGRVAPNVARRPNLHLASDAALAAAVEKLGGTPAEIFSDPEAWALYSGALRADFQLAQDWPADRFELVDTPMTILSGSNDPETWPEGLREWRRYARGQFEMRELPGSHFFPFECPEAFLQLLAERIQRQDAGLADLWTSAQSENSLFFNGGESCPN